MKYLNTGGALLVTLQRLNLTQTQIAQKTGVSNHTVGNWARNKTTMGLESLFSVCKAMDVNPYDFIKLAEKLGDIEREVA